MEAKRPLGLYLHIPFCRKKCFYCDFLSTPASDDVVGRYVKALGAQMEREACAYRGHEVQTVFFGGGTPSLLSAARLDFLMEKIRKNFSVAQNAEISMESNPGTLSADTLSGYFAAGINRLSIGLQSTREEELRELGRIHDYRTFLENYEAARRVGFSNINIDLMSALPGQTLESWLDTLKKAAELSPEHISAYSLMIEEGTPFYERYGEGGGRDASLSGESGEGLTRFLTAQPYPPLPSEDEERRMYEQTKELLGTYGYRRYEISNYARPGYECRHNIGYWRRTDYLGLGLGASSLVKNVRWKNTEDLTEYLEVRAPGRLEVQALSVPEQMEEFCFLGLRMSDGIRVSRFRTEFGTGIREVYGQVLDRLEKEGLIVFYEDGKRIKLTERGIDVSNYVLAQFLL